jgi:hypothetical protein
MNEVRANRRDYLILREHDCFQDDADKPPDVLKKLAAPKVKRSLAIHAKLLVVDIFGLINGVCIVVKPVRIFEQILKLANVCAVEDLLVCINALPTDIKEWPEQASRRKVVRVGNAHECLEYVAKCGGDLPLPYRVGSRKILDNQRMAPVVVGDAVPSYVPRLQCRSVVTSDDPERRSG